MRRNHRGEFGTACHQKVCLQEGKLRGTPDISPETPGGGGLSNPLDLSDRLNRGTNQPGFAGRAFLGNCQGTPTTKPNSRSLDVFVPLKYLIAFPAFFLMLYGTLPVAVSAMYGGNPPPHIANLLDKQMDTFSTVAKMIFGPITLSNPAVAASEKVASKEPP